MSHFVTSHIYINYQGQRILLEHSSIIRGCDKTILFLHGLGATKSDFEKFQNPEKFMNFNVISLDFPGTRKSNYIENISIEDLVEITHIWLHNIGINTVTIIGHSMGGLVGLLYAKKYPQNVDFFVNVEGNLMADDCGFSRYISLLPPNEFQEKFGSFPSMRSLSKSMIKLSESGILMNIFKNMANKSIFIYGSNSKISYLDELRSAGLIVIEISKSFHHPFLENPDEFYKKILDHIL